MTDATLSPVPALATPQRDFADWLSPMIVKELRQGLRANAFVAVFLIVQVLMLLCMFLLAMSAKYSTGTNDLGFYNGLFWFAIGVFLLAAMPLRGLLAVQSEIKANTLELIYLTRLTATKIILGKWCSIVLQSWLIVAAILPYFVLRYFFGGIEIVSDLTTLGVMLLLNAVLTALMIALSTAPLAIRILLLIPTVIAGFWGIIALMVVLFSPFGSSVGLTNPFSGGIGLFAIIYFVAGYSALLLEIGVTRIAPEAENHAGRKRLLALLMLVPALLALGKPPVALGLLLTATPALIYVFAESLSERLPLIPSLFQRFARRGFWGKLVAYWFTPGWASGLLFTLTISVPFALGFLVFANQLTPRSSGSHSRVTTPLGWFHFDNAELLPPLLCVAILGALILPVIILHTLMKRARQPLLNYAFIQVGFLIIGTVCTTLLHLAKTDAAIYPVAYLPGATLLYLLTQNDGSAYVPLFMIGNSVTLLITLVILAPMAFRQFRQIAALLKKPAEPAS